MDTISSICRVQVWFAATGRLAWNETASAARLNAEHAEEEVAAGGPVARLVDMFVSRLELVQHTTEARPFDDTFCDRRRRLLDHCD